MSTIHNVKWTNFIIIIIGRYIYYQCWGCFCRICYMYQYLYDVCMWAYVWMTLIRPWSTIEVTYTDTDAFICTVYIYSLNMTYACCCYLPSCCCDCFRFFCVCYCYFYVLCIHIVLGSHSHYLVIVFLLVHKIMFFYSLLRIEYQQ